MDTKPDGLEIGIMGGTFDPIHYGHLMIAENAAEQFGLDQIWFMPNGNPPHKRNSNITSAEHRCAMVELAIAGNPRFTLSRREVDADGCSAHRFLILWDEIICQNAVILAAVRDLTDDGALQDQIRHLTEKYQAEIFRIQTPNFSISSHNIRKRCAEQTSIRYLLPDRVREYIAANNLYCGAKKE